MSYQPFSRADRNRWRRNETPRRALYLTEWHGRRFAAWARQNPSARWRADAFDDAAMEASRRLIDAVLACDGIEPIRVEMACDYTPPEVEAARAAAREAFKLRWGAP